MKEPLLLSRLPFVWRFSPLARKVYQFYDRRRFRWPIYDVSRYFINAESRKLYRIARAGMAPNSVEQSVIRDLRETGISVRQVSELLPHKMFSDLQGWAETRVREPAIQERIKAIEGGARPEAKANKFYILRPLGDKPVVDVRDEVMLVSLSDPILRIVCGYFGMLSRLAAIDLWYNVATDGPDVVSQRWHRDPEDRRIVKTFLYLRDVDETNGPFCYIPGSQNGGPFRAIYPQTIAASNYPEDGAVDSRFTPNQKQVCTGKAGTLIFCDTTGFHRGGHATAGARLLINAVYTTNAGASVIAQARNFSLIGHASTSLAPAAGYAIGHLGDR